MTLKHQLEKLAKEHPLVLHTDAGRLFSTVRRMKAERKMGIPIFYFFAPVSPFLPKMERRQTR